MSDLVIIPTYNERENIENLIDTVLALPMEFHILIVDDNSPDGTAEAVKDKIKQNFDTLFLIERKQKKGLGTAYIAGFQWAVEHNYDFIYEMDADFSHDPRDLIRLHEACVGGADLAIGSRYISGVNVINWPMSRVLMSYFASIYVRFITNMDIMDTTAGFKCYKRRVLETILRDKIQLHGYGFQIEMKYTTYRYGFRIVEIPIVFTDRKRGESKMSGGIFNEAVWGVIAMRLRSFFRSYKR